MGKRKWELLDMVRFAVAPSAWLGMFPCHQKAGGYGISSGRSVVSVAVCLSVSLLTGLLLFAEPGEGLYTSTEVSVMYLAATVGLVETLIRLDALNGCVESLEEVDEAVNALGGRTRFAPEKKFLWRSVCFGCGLATLTFIRKDVYDAKEVLNDPGETVLFAVLACQMVALVHRYSGLLRPAYLLLEACKRELVVSSRLDPSPASRRLESLVEIHCRLAETSVRLNQSFSLQILAVIFACLVLCILAAHSVFASLFTSDKRAPPDQ